MGLEYRTRNPELKTVNPEPGLSGRKDRKKTINEKSQATDNSAKATVRLTVTHLMWTVRPSRNASKRVKNLYVKRSL